MKPSAILFPLLVGIAPVAGANTGHSPQNASFSDQWSAVDGLGRVLPTHAEVGPPRTGRYVGVFYWLWHASIRLPAGTPPVVQDVINANPASPAFRAHDYYWGEPENGFYHPSDPWVIRRHLTMLAQAGVDFIYLDYTNGPLGRESLGPFMQVALELRLQGLPVPRIVFFLNENYDAAINSIMDEFYNRPEYQPLWFYWYGKPLIMADHPKCSIQSARCATAAVRDFFTWRRTWAFRNDWWTFIDDFPQRVFFQNGVAEQIAVNKGMGAPLGNGFRKGSSFANNTMPPYDQFWLPVQRDLTHRGLYFEEHWTRARAIDPEIICVTGWNEWTAAAWPTTSQSFMNKAWNDPSWRCVSPETCIHRDANGNHIWPHGWFMVDQFNEEFNRDIEPMKGGYTDNYYYQMVANIRRYKGMAPPETPSAPQTIAGPGATAWNAVVPVHRDAEGDTRARNFRSVTNHTTYTNTTGRNDIVEARVTHDARNVLFHARTAQNLTASGGTNWMVLFLNTDRNPQTGWMGYDFVINRAVHDSSTTTLQRWSGGAWVHHALLPMEISGRNLQIRVPRDLIGQTGTQPALEFKWADNVQNLASIESFFTTGDVAPDRRFNYIYRNSGATFDNGLTRIADQTVPANGSTAPLALSLQAGGFQLGNLTLTATSSDPQLVPPGAFVFRGTGTERTVTITPAWGHTGRAQITVRATDGVRESLMTFFVTVEPQSSHRAFDFDTLQGWTTVSTDAAGRQFFAVIPPSRSSPHRNPQAGTGFLGLHIPAFGGTPAYTQDSAHDTLWMRSPPFRLNRGQALTAWLSGGGAGSTDVAGTLEGTVPRPSVAGGFRGLALRDTSTGNLVLTSRRTANDNGWQEVGFTAAQLDALPAHRVYTLDLIDAGHGSWGWVALDSVRIPGTLAVPEEGAIPVLTLEPWDGGRWRLVWPSTFREWRLQHTDTLGTAFIDSLLPVTEEGGRNHVYDNPPARQRFYRLRR